MWRVFVCVCEPSVGAIVCVVRGSLLETISACVFVETSSSFSWQRGRKTLLILDRANRQAVGDRTPENGYIQYVLFCEAVARMKTNLASLLAVAATAHRRGQRTYGERTMSILAVVVV